MKATVPLRLALVSLCASASVFAQQPWAGILDPSRAVNWSTAGAGSIPNRTTNCATTQCNTLYAGTVTSASINAAISSAPANSVVRIPAGTYTIASGIMVNALNNITIRGAGPDQTFLKFSGGNSCNGLGAGFCVIMADGSWNQDGPENTANWTAGYSQGTTVVTLSSVSGLSPGMFLALDQLDDTTDSGSVYNCQVVGKCTQQGTDVGRGTTDATKRSQMQLVIVQSINGNNVTISPGLYMPNWRASQSPGAWWPSSQPITGVGIEEMSLDYTNLGTSQTYAIQFMGAYKCWVRNIRSINANNAHINMYLSSHLTIRDSYFYGTQNAASQSYGFEPWMGGDHLWENNIFQHVASPYVMSGGQGIVASYTYAFDDYYNNGDPAWFQAAMYHHESGSNYDLWEGNNVPGMTADNIHGPGFFATAFRNRIDGKDPLNTNTKTEQTVPVDIYSFSRFFNIIGNVLGTSGYHTTYEVYTTTTGAQDGTNCDVTIYRLGWGGNCANTDNPGDTTLRSTMMRWGNYDTVNGGVRFVNSEVPSGLSLYANAVPASQTLPSSFYLSGTPSFWGTPWGTPPWPANGPDVTGGNIANVGGHANLIPAQLCYNNSPVDSNYGSKNVKLYNADNCYTTSISPVQPPTGIQVTVH